MKGYKLYVMNEEQSRQAQEKAFELGYKWEYYGKKVKFTDNPFLYFDENMEIATDIGLSFSFFKEVNNKEISLSEWLSMEKPRKAYKAKGCVIGIDRNYDQDYSEITIMVKGLTSLTVGLTKYVKIKEIL